MGKRPARGYQIDRKDNNGPYSAENCHWTTSKQNSRNRRSNRPLTLNGRTMLLSDWATEKGIALSTLHKRLGHGWSLERALTEPPRRVCKPSP
jgi:hypothetical protein